MWGYKAHKREIGFTHVMYVTRLSSLCERVTSTIFFSTVALCLFARVAAIGSRPTRASTDTRSFLGFKHHHRKSFCSFSMWGNGGGEEMDGSVQLQEEGRHPLPSQLKIYYLVFNKNKLCNVLSFLAINNHIHLFLYEEKYFYLRFQLEDIKLEDNKCLPSQQHFDNPAVRKDIGVPAAIS